jgi:hypothetical protein
MIRKYVYSMGLLSFVIGSPGLAIGQDGPAAVQGQAQSPPPDAGHGQGRRGGMEGHGTIGKITALTGSFVVLTKPDGTAVNVKLTDQTEIRKDRQPAKLADFKVGDFVMVRGDENADHTLTAQSLSGRSGNGGPGGGMSLGEMGKDFVAGEVKSIDAPKLTVLRSDNVTQTLEFTEDTSLHKGRESVTMADIQPGDHVVIRGALQNNAFVPKSVMVLSPEQWQRMQQFVSGTGGPGGSAPVNAPPKNPPQ